jgi:hypothetical protein
MAGWVLPVAALVALLIGVGIGASGNGKPKTVTVAGPTTVVQQVSTLFVPGPTITAPGPTVRVTVKPKPVPVKPVVPPPTHAAAGITYRISGNGSSALITYSVDGSIEQANDASIPWSKVIPTGGIALVLSAQDKDGTAITCEIIGVDGSVLSRHTSTGAYAIAQCSA